jgi:cysteinyl-tRNA synthetase
VTYVRNFTDVDDKINAEAQRRKATGRPESLEALIAERSDETIAWYHADMDALGAARPDHEPRATEYIAQMISMIEGLIGSGHAYEAAGHVLFRVRSYADYGALSGRSVDDMIAGARVEVAPFKEDPMDFVLWKPSDDDLPGWDSPWGKGRPGWHIECSAMADELLMKDLPEADKAFDIHGGGLDLQFPHHENELAQSKCAHPKGGFANVWLHNEMLMVEGRKMSKSLGNFFTVRDLLDQGVPGEVIRFVFLMTHYRSPMDWTERKRQEAVVRLDKMLPAMQAAIRVGLNPTGRFEDLPFGFQSTLSDDLNTSGALTILDGAAERLVSVSTGDTIGSLEVAAREFVEGLNVLGLYDLLIKRTARRVGASEQLDGIHLRFVTILERARQTKDFSSVDALRTGLLAAGVEVRMSKAEVALVPGPTFDPAKLEALK